MYASYDTFNKIIVSKHRTITKAILVSKHSNNLLEKQGYDAIFDIEALDKRGNIRAMSDWELDEYFLEKYGD